MVNCLLQPRLTKGNNSSSLGDRRVVDYFSSGLYLMDRVGAPFWVDKKHDIAFSFWCGALDEEEEETQEQFLKSGNRFSDKNCGKNKKLEQSVEGLSETKTALEGRVDELLGGQLLVTRFSVEETIFGVAHAEMMLVSRRDDLDLDRLIDQPATLTIHHKYLDKLRHFSGIITKAAQGNSSPHRTSYRLSLQPSLVRLDYGADCRIFQGKTVPEIVEVILKENGIEDVEWQITQEHQPREFLVCYRETHLAFIERILAEEGIFYYFQHEKRGKSSLILTDNPDDLPDCPGQQKLSYNAQAGGVHYGVYCSSVERMRKLRSTTFASVITVSRTLYTPKNIR